MATVRRIVRVPEESSESSGREPAAKLSRKLAATRPQTTRLSRAAGMMTQRNMPKSATESALTRRSERRFPAMTPSAVPTAQPGSATDIAP